MSFRQMLVSEIRYFMKERKISVPEKMLVKVAGDGVRVTRNTSMQLFGFSLLNWGRDVLSPSAVRTVAVMCGSESYETLKTSMQATFREVSDIIKAGKLVVDGADISAKIYFCGDLKYKQMVLSLKGSTTTYGCVL